MTTFKHFWGDVGLILQECLYVLQVKSTKYYTQSARTFIMCQVSLDLMLTVKVNL